MRIVSLTRAFFALFGQKFDKYSSNNIKSFARGRYTVSYIIRFTSKNLLHLANTFPFALNLPDCRSASDTLFPPEVLSDDIINFEFTNTKISLVLGKKKGKHLP